MRQPFVWRSRYDCGWVVGQPDVGPKRHRGSNGSRAVEGEHFPGGRSFVRAGQNNEIFPEIARDYFLKTFDSQITFVTEATVGRQS